MTSNIKLVRISELKPGMISAKDIIFDNKILLAKNMPITKSIIDKLRKSYIVNKVEVYTKYDLKSLNLKIKAVHELQNTFNKLSSNLEEMFYKISNLKVSETNEIKKFAKKIQEELNSTGTVIRNIVLYGSKGDPIYRHSINVAAISNILGKWLCLNETTLNLLTYSAILHDFGKIKLDTSIVNNKKLSEEEYKIFKTHPIIGYNFIKEIPYLSNSVLYGVLMHHERMDGSGYPLSIKGDKIHKFAKIIAIADLFDELNSNRYYKNIKGPFEALKIIQEESLGKLDYKYSTIFLNHIINYYIGEDVLLNNKKSYKIIQIKINDLTNPLLMNKNGFLNLKNEKNLYIKSFYFGSHT